MKKSFAVFAIFLATLAVYAPVIRNGFVWDDTALVLRDPLIRSWRLIPEGFNHFLFVDATASDFYRPVQRLTYLFDYAAFSFSPVGYHVTNVLLHAAAAIAFFFFAGQLLEAFRVTSPKRDWIAFCAALVWALHPVHTAAVVYISGRADPLAAAFGFSGCYFLLRSRTSPGRMVAWLLAAAFLFSLGALSKESGLFFPALGLVLAVLLKDTRFLWRTLVVAAFVATPYFSLRLAAEHNTAPRSTQSSSLGTRPILMARAVAEYAGLIILPLNLHMDRELNARPTESIQTNMNTFAAREIQTLVGAALFAALVYWTVRTRKRLPVVSNLLIVSGLAYLPVSGIVALNAPVAEHWIYVPTAFLFLAISVYLAHLLETRQPGRVVLGSSGAVIACWMLFLGARTCLRTFDWKDQRTFLERTIASGGDSPRMLVNLGGLELSEGKLDKAKVLLDSALKKEKDQPLAVLNLAVVALRQNDFKTARTLALSAVQMPWVEAQAYELMAVLDNKEKGEANPLRLRLAARTGPPNWGIEKRYVRFMDETGATNSAIRELQTCLQTQWYRAESWELLGQLLGKIGMRSEAAIAQRQAAAYDVHLSDHASFL